MDAECEWFYIRKAVPSDADAIFKQMREFAKFVKCEDMPKISVGTFESDIQQGHLIAYVAVAKQPISSSDADCIEVGSVIGHLIYYYTYSTWEGRMIFIEEIYVRESCRRRGVGSCLWGVAAGVANEENLPQIEFAVLNWNQAAVKFYEKMGAENLTVVEGLHYYRLGRKELEKVALPVPRP